MNAAWSQVPLVHRLMLGTSVGALVVTALILWRTVPLLPPQITLHFISLQGDRLASPSTLWGLWWAIAVGWLAMEMISLAAQRAGRLEDAPTDSAHGQPGSQQEMRGVTLAMRIIAPLIGCGLLISTVVQGLGGPQLEGLALLPLLVVPVTLWYWLHRMSRPNRRDLHRE